jgi:hypothetical protein
MSRDSNHESIDAKDRVTSTASTLKEESEHVGCNKKSHGEDVIVVNWDGPDDTANPQKCVWMAVCLRSVVDVHCVLQLELWKKMGSYYSRFIVHIYFSRVLVDGCPGQRTAGEGFGNNESRSDGNVRLDIRISIWYVLVLFLKLISWDVEDVIRSSPAIGPLILGPLSEIYGRCYVLQSANMFYLGNVSPFRYRT